MEDQISNVPSIRDAWRSEEHTSELQSLTNLVCRLLLEKKKSNLPGPLPRVDWLMHSDPLKCVFCRLPTRPVPSYVPLYHIHMSNLQALERCMLSEADL